MDVTIEEGTQQDTKPTDGSSWTVAMQGLTCRVILDSENRWLFLRTDYASISLYGMIERVLVAAGARPDHVMPIILGAPRLIESFIAIVVFPARSVENPTMELECMGLKSGSGELPRLYCKEWRYLIPSDYIGTIKGLFGEIAVFQGGVKSELGNVTYIAFDARRWLGRCRGGSRKLMNEAIAHCVKGGARVVYSEID
jgi:hypothetical protein